MYPWHNSFFFKAWIAIGKGRTCGFCKWCSLEHAKHEQYIITGRPYPELSHCFGLEWLLVDGDGVHIMTLSFVYCFFLCYCVPSLENVENSQKSRAAIQLWTHS